MTDFRLGDYLDHMRDAANDALEFIRGKTRDEFLQDRLTQQAVTMWLIVVGEASVRLAERYPEFIDQNPQIAWQQIRGMRNRIVHGYFQINMDTVRGTTSDGLPRLIEQIAAAKARLPATE